MSVGGLVARETHPQVCLDLVSGRRPMLGEHAQELLWHLESDIRRPIFTKAILRHLPFMYSYHRPLLSEMNPNSNHLPKVFVKKGESGGFS